MVDNIDSWAQLGFSYFVGAYLLVRYHTTIEKQTEKLNEISTTLKVIAEKLDKW